MDFYRYLNLLNIWNLLLYIMMEDPSFIFFWLLSKPPFSLLIGIIAICSFLKSSISFCP